jgi:hypothetical protein
MDLGREGGREGRSGEGSMPQERESRRLAYSIGREGGREREKEKLMRNGVGIFSI